MTEASARLAVYALVGAALLAALALVVLPALARARAITGAL